MIQSRVASDKTDSVQKCLHARLTTALSLTERELKPMAYPGRVAASNFDTNLTRIPAI